MTTADKTSGIGEEGLRRALEWALDCLDADDEVTAGAASWAVVVDGKTTTMAKSSEYDENKAKAREALAARSSSAPAELEALRELSDAATPGPWHAYFTVHGDPSVVLDPERPAFTKVLDIATTPDDYGRADAELIVAAVNYVRSRLTSSPENPA